MDYGNYSNYGNYGSCHLQLKNTFSMKKSLILAAAALLALPAAADVTLTLQSQTTYPVEILEMPLTANPEPKRTPVTLDANGTAHYQQGADPAHLYVIIADRPQAEAISLGANDPVTIYLNTGYEATLGGNDINLGITQLDTQLRPIMEAMQAAGDTYETNPLQAEQAMEKLAAQGNDVIRTFIAAHADEPVAAYALTQLDGEEFLAAYETLTPAARQPKICGHLPLRQRHLG